MRKGYNKFQFFLVILVFYIRMFPDKFSKIKSVLLYFYHPKNMSVSITDVAREYHVSLLYISQSEHIYNQEGRVCMIKGMIFTIVNTLGLH